LAKRSTVIIAALIVALATVGALGDQFAPIVRPLPPTDPALLAESAVLATTATSANKPVAVIIATEPAVCVDKEHSRIRLRGRFNGPASLLEAGACTKSGRTATALVTLAATPSAIAEAMKELGVGPGEVPVASAVDGSVVPPHGRKMTLMVEWKIKINGQDSPMKARLEDFFWIRSREAHPAEGPWIYAGSKSVQGVLVADLSGTVATTKWDDTSALFYFQTRPGSENYRPNPSLSPAEGTPCDVVVEIIPEEPATTKPADLDVGPTTATTAQSAAAAERGEK
jgi:hypothetical protein